MKKHTKFWLIVWLVVNAICFIAFSGIGVYWGIYKENPIAGIYFWIFAGIFLISAIQNILALIRHEWITRDAINELYREEVEKRKEEFKRS